jgi:hypothetical protein
VITFGSYKSGHISRMITIIGDYIKLLALYNTNRSRFCSKVCLKLEKSTLSRSVDGSVIKERQNVLAVFHASVIVGRNILVLGVVVLGDAQPQAEEQRQSEERDSKLKVRRKYFLRAHKKSWPVLRFEIILTKMCRVFH